MPHIDDPLLRAGKVGSIFLRGQENPPQAFKVQPFCTHLLVGREAAGIGLPTEQQAIG